MSTEIESCMRVLREVYWEHTVEEFGEQGFCSLTLLATPLSDQSITDNNADTTDVRDERRDRKELIIQLRLPQYALDLDVIRVACTAYPSLAPKLRPLDLNLPGGLHAYEIERLYGVPFSRLQPRCHILDAETCRKYERLVTSLAAIIARTWPTSSKDMEISRHVRADSPMDDVPTMLSQCTGTVGSTITERLRKLASELPDAKFRDRAHFTLRTVRSMNDYPVVLNHGDLIPANILVDEETWEITGLVDWAEAEVLPFGTCLYGLEHLLGFMRSPSSDRSSQGHEPPTFVYFDNTAQLRDLFWMRLLDAVPELRSRREDVEAMRDLGILLWRGIAWDDGAIDRVVNEVDDAGELEYLRAFLEAP